MKSFVIPIYGSKVTLVRTFAELEKACNAAGIEVPDRMVEGITIQGDYDSGRTRYILGWFDGNESVLAHEATHLAHFILRRAGIDPNDSNAETMAYLVGWIVDRCMTKGRKQ